MCTLNFDQFNDSKLINNYQNDDIYLTLRDEIDDLKRQLFEKDEYILTIHEHFICPITYKLYRSPVIASDGQMYEKSAIKKWICEKKISPITNEDLTDKFVKCSIVKNFINNVLCNVKNKYEPEYVKNYEHNANVEKIKKIITSKKYEKLIKYIKFDLKYFHTNGGAIENLVKTATPETIKYFIDNTVNIESIFEDGWKIIHMIFRSATSDIIKYLIDKNVDLEHKTQRGMKPLDFLIENKKADVEIIQYAINKGIDLISFDGKNNKPIHRAFQSRSLDIIKLMLKQNINIYQEDDDENTMLPYIKTRFNLIEIIADQELVELLRKQHNQHAPEN